ncbi:hypothetical protein EXE42_05000 [Halorubrum sp. SP3]|uniref:DUF7097 family protein n=1 Tax=Halorubrum sp. SP3 TaxID=1537265 RepID=UPI0010F4B0F8|nr:hypothetical protein [Halorubrum sp. SP3]TKX55313.1 hypothetical protein EXE42_05000 [Halorubrum sp. SP3]
MERTPDGTPVGVDDPYAAAGVCDHLTDDGRCRFALTRAGDDPEFAADRRADGYDCHVGADGEWRACPHYRSTTDAKECVRCGVADVRLAHDDSRPLVEEHHLSYGGDDSHEITVGLCRWCHAKVHESIARIGDDASPDPEAIAERERRRETQRSASAFEPAGENYDPGE